MATKYEYKSKINGETFTSTQRFTEDEMKELQIKRVWGGAFVWPKNQRGH